VREDHQRVADGNPPQGHVRHLAVLAAVGHRGHAASQCLQHGRGAAHRVGFERLAAGEHQHDQRAGQILAEQGRRDDGNAGQQVRAELPVQQSRQQVEDERDAAAGQCGDQR
jgi:hypothetical protein